MQEKALKHTKLLCSMSHEQPYGRTKQNAPIPKAARRGEATRLRATCWRKFGDILAAVWWQFGEAENTVGAHSECLFLAALQRLLKRDKTNAFLTRPEMRSPDRHPNQKKLKGLRASRAETAAPANFQKRAGADGCITTARAGGTVLGRICPGISILRNGYVRGWGAGGCSGGNTAYE